MEYLPSIISAIGTVLAAWFAYNQYTKNKLTDFKIEQWKQLETNKESRYLQSMAAIYSELYRLLHDLQIDRVYIVQPHPLINNLYITISMEVKRRGVSPMLGQIRRLPMGEVAQFVGMLVKEDWTIMQNIENDTLDTKARAILSINGTTQICIKKLINHDNSWIGSLFVESTEDVLFDFEKYKSEIYEVANIIQYLLPEYKDIQDEI